MRRLAFAAAAALLLTSLPSGETRAVIPADGVVAFGDHCARRLYAMNPDGTGRHLLPDVGAGGVVDVSRGVGPVTVLAAGQRPLPDGGSKPTLYAIDASGTQAPVELLDETEPTPSEAAMSPTGDRVAFVHKYWDPVAEVGHADLGIGDIVRDAVSGAIIDVENVTFVVDLWTLGSPGDAIGDLGYVFTGPLDFAPDGRRLVVTIYDDLWELTLDADTGRTLVEARPITRTTSFAERMPSWSPIADVVAFSGGPYSTSGGRPLALYLSDMEIYTADVSAGTARQVTNARNKGSSGDGRNNPAWSRNGSYLLFDALGPAAFGKRGQSSCGGASNSDLFQIPADGSLKAVNITNTSGTGVEYGPAWGW
jgi:hypothetical protein